MAGVRSHEIAVVVVNYGSHQLLPSDLGETSHGNTKIVVVDNFTTMEERRSLTHLARERTWRVIENEHNCGFGIGANQGITAALSLGAEFVVLLNPDARIGPADLLTLANRCAADPDALVAPVIFRPDGRLWFSGARVARFTGRSLASDASETVGSDGWLTGACLAFSASGWQKHGGFNGDYFMYWEDIDLSFRWRASGGNLQVAEDVHVVHDVGGTQGAQTKSLMYYMYNCRNRLVFASHHVTGIRLASWLLTTPLYAYQVLLRGGRRQFLRDPLRPILAAARGSALGVSYLVRARTLA